MQFKRVSLFILFLILAFAGCDSKSENSKPETIQNAISKKDSSFYIDLITTDNEKIKAKVTKGKIELKGLENKVVLLNFFATWCPPCKAEIPHLNALSKKYSQEFEVVSVLLEKDKPLDEIVAFIDEFNVGYKVTHTSSNYLLEQAVGGVKSIPTMFLIDKSGNIKQKYLGIVLEEMLEIDIKKAIGK